MFELLKEWSKIHLNLQNQLNLQIIDDYFGSGYGVPTIAGQKAADLMYNKFNLKLDQTYTAKTFAAILGLLENNQYNKKVILYWHTYNQVDLSTLVNYNSAEYLPVKLKNFFSL